MNLQLHATFPDSLKTEALLKQANIPCLSKIGKGRFEIEFRDPPQSNAGPHPRRCKNSGKAPRTRKVEVTMNKSFTMKIKELFYFADGITDFAGEIAGQPKSIGPCPCDLRLNGNTLATIYIEGEIIPRGTNATQRAVTTKQKLSIAREDILRQTYELVYTPQ